MHFAKNLAIATSLLFLPAIVQAQTVTPATPSMIKDCDQALIKDTYQSTDTRYIDWRMAESLDEKSYDKAKADFGANAVIYGVPVGASYGQFKESIKTFNHAKQESYNEQTFRNVAIAALSDNGLKAYQACLTAAATAARKSLVLLPAKATETSLDFILSYTPTGAAAPNPLPIKWTNTGGSTANLPSKIPAGNTHVIVRRPTTNSMLALNAIAIGDGDSVILTPLPKPLPEPDRFATSCQITQTPDPLPNAGDGGGATWLCPAMLAGNYRVTASVTPTGASMGGGVRLGYSLRLDSVGPTKASQALPLNSGNTIDVGIEAGISHTFQSVGGVVTIPNGPAQFVLSLGAIYSHGNFASPAGGVTISIPKDVIFKLDRI